jgi:hypothetical protein
MAMISLKTKAFAVALACLAGLGLQGSTQAQAKVFQVDLIGSFSLSSGSVPFSGSFDVDTSIMPIQHISVGGVDLTGYPDGAISNVSIAAFGMSFSAADVLDTHPIVGEPGSAVFFSADLRPGATPAISMRFLNGSSEFGLLIIGDFSCPGSGCSFNNGLSLILRNPPRQAAGTVAASVVATPEPSTWTLLILGFAGLGFAGIRGSRKARLALAAN